MSDKKAAQDDYHTITLEEGFRAQPQNLYEALTNSQAVSVYTRSPAKIDLIDGGKFTLFDGEISGTIVSLSPPNEIVEKWRFKEWREDDYSTVTITLSAPDRETCKLTLVQTGIPQHDRYGNRDVPNKVELGWKQFFFHPIHQILGYGKVNI